MSQPIAIRSSGMVSGVGLNAPASCAAIRCAIDNFQETRFMDSGGEWIIGSEVALEKPWRGTAKLSRMLAAAILECATEDSLQLDKVPVLICVAENERPGRLADLEQEVYLETQAQLGIRFHEKSGIISAGRTGIGAMLEKARKLIYQDRILRVVIAGTDSFLAGPVLGSLEERERLLTSQNSNGFIPGEAAAALTLAPISDGPGAQLMCMGLGRGVEPTTEESEQPLRADGLVEAIRGALRQAGCQLGDLDFRMADVSGGQYSFKEAALAMTRVLRKRKEEFDIWHPADCIGEVGAAAGPVSLAVLLAANRKSYAPGRNVLCHFADDNGERCAAVLSYRQARSS